LGVVNRFVEHGDTRVVLCANTDNLKDDDFKAFKEKVVGHSFSLESDPDGALASFINEIKQDQARKALLKYQNDILGLYGKSGFHNLRALRQFIWQLASILEKMKEDYCQNDKLVQSLIVQFFIFFIEFKLDLADETSSLTPQDLLNKYNVGMDKVRHVYEFSLDKDEEPTPKRRVLSKYEQHNGIKTVITVQHWISILTSGVIDTDRLNAELAQSYEIAGDEAWPSWRRLWHIFDWDFSDGSEVAFWSDVEDMQSNLNQGRYVEVGEFLHVVGVSIMLADLRLIDQTVPETITQLKTYIDEKFVAQLTDERCRGIKENLGSHDGLGFMEREKNEFKEVMTYLTQKMDAWHQNWLNEDAGKQLLKFLTEDLIRFFGNLTIINHAPEQRYLDVPILATIDVATFVDAWLSLSRQDERRVLGRMRDRYNSRPTLLDTEGPWWNKIQDELKLRIARSKSKPRNVQIQQLIDQIGTVILN
jgi:hypothetical protein